MDKRVYAGTDEDWRWQPGYTPGVTVPEPEKEPAVEPEPVAEDLESVAVSPKHLPSQPAEVPSSAEPVASAPDIDHPVPSDSVTDEFVE